MGFFQRLKKKRSAHHSHDREYGVQHSGFFQQPPHFPASSSQFPVQTPPSPHTHSDDFAHRSDPRAFDQSSSSHPFPQGRHPSYENGTRPPVFPTHPPQGAEHPSFFAQHHYPQSAPISSHNFENAAWMGAHEDEKPGIFSAIARIFKKDTRAEELSHYNPYAAPPPSLKQDHSFKKFERDFETRTPYANALHEHASSQVETHSGSHQSTNANQDASFFEASGPQDPKTAPFDFQNQEPLLHNPTPHAQPAHAFHPRAQSHANAHKPSRTFDPSLKPFATNDLHTPHPQNVPPMEASLPQFMTQAHGGVANSNHAQSNTFESASSPHPLEAQRDAYAPNSYEQEDNTRYHHGFSAKRSHDIPVETEGTDLRELRFWNTSSSNHSAPPSQAPHPSSLEGDPQEDEQENQPLRFVIALGLVVIFTAMAWLAFRWSTQTATHMPPHISYEDGPHKVRPDHPGGLLVPHQDKLVYERIEQHPSHHASQFAPVERLLPPPELPLRQESAHPYYEGQFEEVHAYGPPSSSHIHPHHGRPVYVPVQAPYPPHNSQATRIDGPSQNAPYPQPAYSHQRQAPQSFDGTMPSHASQPSAHHQDMYVEDPHLMQGTRPVHVPAPVPHGQNVSEQTSDSQSHEAQAKQHDQNVETRDSDPAEETPEPSHVIQRPTFYKAKLASLPTKEGAEKEWKRLRAKYKSSFKNLNKAIIKEQSHGKFVYGVYALGLKTEKQAQAFCKKVGHCRYKKQES